MKAALVQADGSLKIGEVPTPSAGPGDVVVKVAYCGICGSDLHLIGTSMLPPGCIIGHELSGTVVEIGAGVEGWALGDAVTVLPIDPCFTCSACGRGDIQQCREGVVRGYGLGINPGGFAQYMRVRPSMLFRLPQGLDLKTAALNEPWSVALHGVNQAGVSLGAPAAVMGAGPIGLFSLMALNAAGAGRIFVSEPDPYRRSRAEAAGADFLIDPSRDYPGAVIMEELGASPSYVFDCAGTEASLEEASAIVGGGGIIIALGVPIGNAVIFPLPWFAKEIRVKFSLGYTYKEFGRGLELLAKGAVKFDAVVSDIMSLTEVDRAFTLLKGSGHSKILIDCRAV